MRPRSCGLVILLRIASALCRPFDAPATTAGPTPAVDLDTAKLDQIMGAKGTATGGVYQFAVPRRDPATAGAVVAIVFAVLVIGGIAYFYNNRPSALVDAAQNVRQIFQDTFR